MSKYDHIKTAAELVDEVRANGLSREIEDLVRAQEILDGSTTEELVRLANNIGPNGEPAEAPTGTGTGHRRPTQKTFYHIAFAVWKWEDAMNFFNEHTNPEHMAFEEVKAENARLRAAKAELEDQRDTLQHELDMEKRESEKLRQDSRSMIAALEDAEAEVVNLKAELYDYIKAMDGGVGV